LPVHPFAVLHDQEVKHDFQPRLPVLVEGGLAEDPVIIALANRPGKSRLVFWPVLLDDPEQDIGRVIGNFPVEPGWFFKTCIPIRAVERTDRWVVALFVPAQLKIIDRLFPRVVD